MRVGILTSYMEGGGAERQAALWAAASSGLGHSVTLLALFEHAADYDVPPSTPVRYIHKAGRFDVLRLAREVAAAAREVDVLLAFQPYPALLCALGRVATPWAVVTGDDPRYWGDTSRIPDFLLRAGLRRAAAASAPTAGLVECHKSLGIRPRGPWMVIPNIADDDAYIEASGANRSGVLFVGRLVRLKNPLLAVEAALAAQAELTVLGEGELKPTIERTLAGRAGASELVSFQAFTNWPWSVYASHRVLVLTSDYEAFGNVVVESLAAGTPVVAVDCDFGPREILDGANYSTLVPRDRDALATALRRVLERPYAEEEAAECRALAEKYRSHALAPLVEELITATTSGPPAADGASNAPGWRERAAGSVAAWVSSRSIRLIRPLLLLVRRTIAYVGFERRFGMETARRVELSDLGLEAENRLHYEPAGWRSLGRILRTSEVAPDDVFIDFGSGKGRVVFQAARLPFKRVIGVELADDLNRVARRNVDRNRARFLTPEVELVSSDALAYEIPDDVTVAYFHNPFQGEILATVIDRLIESHDRHPRTLRVIYENPVERELLERTGRLRLLRRWRRRRPRRDESSTGSILMYEVLASPTPDAGHRESEPHEVTGA